ncbi:MAG: hypothetical protein RLZ45_125 [Verrucomicrobiota bacterium]
MRLPSRIGHLLGGGIFFSMGMLFVSMFLYAIVESVRLRLQAPIEFVVVRTEILPAELGRGGFNLVIHFKEPRRSETPWVELHDVDYRDLLIVQRTLSPGSTVIGRRWPPNSPPRLDLCEPGWRSLLALPVLAVPLVFVGIGMRFLWSATTGREPMPKRTRETPPWAFFIGGTIPVLVGTIAVTILGVLPLRDRARSRDWIPTPATIEMSRVVVSSSHKGRTSHHPEVLYRYLWKGELHRSSTIGGWGIRAESGTRKFVADHPVGSTTTCFVNPKDPTEAIMDRSLSWWMLLSLPFCAFLAFGVMLWRAGWRKRQAVRVAPRSQSFASMITL